jgi:hypothetical protein
MRTIGMIIYLVIGVVVAANRDYVGDVGGIGDILNLLLAVLLWPLVLAGVDFNINIGGGKDGNGTNKNGALWLSPAVAFTRSALGTPRRLARLRSGERPRLRVCSLPPGRS